MKVKQKKEQKLDSLKDAALKVFLRKGFHNCRIEDIIEEASVGKGTFYLYFENKEHLVQKLVDQFIEEVKQVLNWVQDLLMENRNPAEAFNFEAKELDQIFKTNEDLAKFIFKEGKSVSKKIDKTISDFFEDTYEMAEQTFALANELEILNIPHPRIAAICVVGSVSQIYQAYLENKISLGQEELTQETLNYNLRALGILPQNPTSGV